MDLVWQSLIQGEIDMTFSELLDLWFVEKSIEVRNSTKWNYESHSPDSWKPV